MDASDNDRGLYEPAGSASLLACSAMTEDPSNMTGPSPATAKRRVLVVEDEMLIGMLLEDMLTDLGHEVAAIVPRLKDAMAAVERETYDLRRSGRASARRKRFPGRGSADRARACRSCSPPATASAACRRAYRGRPVLQKPFAKDDLERVLKTLFP